MSRKKIIFEEQQWRQIRTLCEIQCTQEEICGVMDTSEETLNRNIMDTYGLVYKEYVKKYSSSGKASLRRMQFKLAERNAGMAIWLGKQYLGQKDIPIAEDIGSVPYIVDDIPDENKQDG